MQDRLARQTILSAALALSALQFLFSGSANSLVGADLVDLSLQRYTVIVANAKGHCTGVVLAQNIVLTAAHCVTNMQNLWIGGDRGFGDPSGPPVLPCIRATIPGPYVRSTLRCSELQRRCLIASSPHSLARPSRARATTWSWPDMA